MKICFKYLAVIFFSLAMIYSAWGQQPEKLRIAILVFWQSNLTPSPQ